VFHLFRYGNSTCKIFGPESRVPKATLVVLVIVVGISPDPKIPKAFLIRIGAQRNFACTFVLTLHDFAHRSTVSDFSLIF